MATGRVNLAQRIGANYTNFGILLLEDEVGDVTEAIVQQHQLKAEDINTHIFRLWLKGEGRKPVSWATLIHVLQDIGLNQLAQDVREVKCSAV